MDVKPEAPTSDTSRQWLRHCVATLAYRGAKALRDAPDGFAEFRISETTQSSGELLAHLGDLLDWALSIAKGKQEWHNSKPLPWDQGVKRFFGALEALDAYLASPAPLHAPADKLFQGPIADALTHVGQIATRRRLADAPALSRRAGAGRKLLPRRHRPRPRRARAVGAPP
jgi:hypothetical protein